MNQHRTLAIADTLTATATTLEARALRIKRRAEQMRGRVISQIEVDQWRNSWRDVLRWMDAGKSESDAIQYVAQRLQCRPETIRHWWEHRQRTSKSISNWHRDREVMRMAALGWTNRQIADQLLALGWGSPRDPSKPIAGATVSRIVRRKLSS